MKCCNLIQCIPSGPALVYTASLYLKFLPSRTLRTKSGWHALATVGENLLDNLFLIRLNSKQNLMVIFKNPSLPSCLWLRISSLELFLFSSSLRLPLLGDKTDFVFEAWQQVKWVLHQKCIKSIS